MEEPGARRTLLCLVIEEGVKLQDLQKVDLLLEARADPDRVSENGTYPLQLAVRHDCFQLSRQLLRASAAVNQPDNKQVTPLHLAAQNDNLKIMQLLLMYQANVNATDRLGQTPLFFAAGVQVLKALFEASADVLHLSTRGQSALHGAASTGAADVAVRLVENDEMCHMLDMPDERGRTALHHAAFRGHHAVVSTLLDMGADPRLKTTSGDTALTLADFKGHSDLAYYIYTRVSGGNRSSWAEVATNPILLTLAAILCVACFVWSQAFPGFVLAAVAVVACVIGYANRHAMVALILSAIAGHSHGDARQDVSQVSESAKLR